MPTQTYLINGSTEATNVWKYWTCGIYTSDSTTANITYNGLSDQANLIWRTWVINGSGTTSVITTAPVFQRYKPPTAEELEAGRKKAEEQAEKTRLANERADALLAEFLDAMQQKQFEKELAFIVETESGRRYEIKRGKRVAEIGKDGKAKALYCIHPVDWQIPAGDVMLAQKLMLETDEAEFLRIANRSVAVA